MTKNRAAKLTARNIAAEQDVRLPEAAYMDDRRKLRLPDGTIHDFSQAAASPRTKNEDLQRIWVAHLIREATSKGWRIFQHRGHTASEALAALNALQAAGPALILIDQDEWVQGEANSYWVMVHHAHDKLNILLSWLPKGCTADPAPWESAGPVEQKPRTLLPVPSAMREIELLKMRLAFARRYGDLESMGDKPHESLLALADDMASYQTGTAEMLAEACKAAAKGMSQGIAGEDLWGPHRTVLGSHLVRMLISGHRSASTVTALRMAADTLESELRVALAERS